ncbi:hypothetical protein KGR96_004427 [Salmonella enterica]|nr:hypothetical protein [Salmonella enterica]EHM6077271.1 hypothetical protein [Salmonella enterica]EIM0630251.1 hypothetical protein [Salmonella enterica]
MKNIHAIPAPKERFSAIADARLIVTSVADAEVKYPRDPSNPKPHWWRERCTEQAYRQAMFEGVHAAKEGQSREDCPYGAHDSRADAWRYGWEAPQVSLDLDPDRE